MARRRSICGEPFRPTRFQISKWRMETRSNRIEIRPNEEWSAMRALIVDEPWISGILSGEKIWEMRSTRVTIRGQIALIRKGSGHVVGVAEIIGCERALESLDEYSDAEPKHRIPPARQRAAFEGGWKIPWVLSNASMLPSPVPYQHPKGAVIWVALKESVIHDVLTQLAIGRNA